MITSHDISTRATAHTPAPHDTTWLPAYEEFFSTHAVIGVELLMVTPKRSRSGLIFEVCMAATGSSEGRHFRSHSTRVTAQTKAEAVSVCTRMLADWRDRDAGALASTYEALLLQTQAFAGNDNYALLLI